MNPVAFGCFDSTYTCTRMQQRSQGSARSRSIVNLNKLAYLLAPFLADATNSNDICVWRSGRGAGVEQLDRGSGESAFPQKPRTVYHCSRPSRRKRLKPRREKQARGKRIQTLARLQPYRLMLINELCINNHD